MKTKTQQVTNRIFTLANLISGLRLLLLPVFWFLLVQRQSNAWAFAVLVTAALTDLIDGQLARFTNTVSKLGIQMDPFIDRIFLVASITAIFAVGRLPIWVMVALFSRDLVMMFVTIYQKRRFQRDFEVIFLGKLATAALMSAFCSLVLVWPLIPGLGLVESASLPGLGAAPAPLGYCLLYIGIACSWVSGIIYVVRGFQPTKPTEPFSQPESGVAKVLVGPNPADEVRLTGDH